MYNRKFFAPLAQLDRASGYEPGGRRFESCRARQPSLAAKPFASFGLASQLFLENLTLSIVAVSGG